MVDHQEIPMLKTVTATYISRAAVTNAVDELVNAGIPREEVYSDDAKIQVKVMVPESGISGVMEILGRHEPTIVS